MHQDPNPLANVVMDATILEAIRDIIIQTIQGIAPTALPTMPRAVGGDQSANTGNNHLYTPSPDNGSNFTWALKTFTSMRPDNYDGTVESVKMAYWFSHIERLLCNVVYTEAEKVHIASLQLKEGASEWWEGTGLAEHPTLNWDMFKDKMFDRFFSSAMREEKLKEFLYPKIEGIKVPELATMFNHLL